ncbi:MAG: hypothetical protein ACI9KE_002418 [Polyangiales bacterium]|jgi:hypothetical protein
MTRPPEEISAVQHRYATRIKARLGAPNIDAKSARDGILDCFVATYFGGLKQGIGGYLGIDANEEHVARIAQALFKKKLVAHGSSFDEPTVDALDRVRAEVDHELHFHMLPAELKGVHDQVCSLMLSKAEGTLSHDGARNAVTGRASQAPAALGRITPRPMNPIAGRPTPTPSNRSSVSLGLRTALSAYLEESAQAVSAGADGEELAKRLTRLERLFATVRDFE